MGAAIGPCAYEDTGCYALLAASAFGGLRRRNLVRIRDNSHVELATLRSRACVCYRPGRFQGLEGPAHGVIAQLEVLGHGLDGHARVALEGRDDKRQAWTAGSA